MSSRLHVPVLCELIEDDEHPVTRDVSDDAVMPGSDPARVIYQLGTSVYRCRKTGRRFMGVRRILPGPREEVNFFDLSEESDDEDEQPSKRRKLYELGKDYVPIEEEDLEPTQPLDEESFQQFDEKDFFPKDAKTIKVKVDEDSGECIWSYVK